jgi:hypothetical protein
MARQLLDQFTLYRRLKVCNVLRYLDKRQRAAHDLIDVISKGCVIIICDHQTVHSGAIKWKSFIHTVGSKALAVYTVTGHINRLK